MQWREKELLDILKNETLKTGDIVDRANMSKTTALKYLESLRAKGLIDCKTVGPTKLWFHIKAKEEIKEGTSKKRLHTELEKYIYIDKRVLGLLEEFERNMGIELNIVVDKNGMRLIFKED